MWISIAGAIASHAGNIVNKLRGDLTNSLKRLGVDTIQGWGKVTGPQKVTVETSGGEKAIAAKDIILAPGVRFLLYLAGSKLMGRTVFTSDDAVETGIFTRSGWQLLVVVISVWSFRDVYTALGCEVTMIEALDQLMPTFDPDIAKLAERVLITPRDIETKVGLLAMKVTPGSPVVVELADAKTKEIVEVLEVDACLVATGRVPVSSNLGLESVGVETVRGFYPCK